MNSASAVFATCRTAGFFLQFVLACSAAANPTGQTVVNGAVTFAVNGSILTITNSPSAIINWSSFSIGAGELTRFIQQSAASSVLNRVIGQDPSAILGALQSNGRVFIINPNGITFGAGAQIDVAGLVASTLNLSNEDFLANRLRFTGGATAGGVVNQGAINAASGGSVYLVGKTVTNEGLITSPGGEVVLAAGNSVELVDPGTPGLRVEIVAPDNEARNLGQIAAASGRIGIYAGLIRSGGVINADRAVNGPGGTIVLKAGGDINFDSGTHSAVGGTIKLVPGGNLSGANGTFVADNMLIESQGGGVPIGDLSITLDSGAVTVGQSGGGAVVLVNSGNPGPGGGNIVANGPVTLTGGNISLNGTTIVTSGNVGSAGGNISTNGGVITLTNSGVSINGATIIATGSITVTGGIISVNGGTVTLTGGTVTLNVREHFSVNDAAQRIPATFSSLLGLLQPSGNFFSPLHAPIFAQPLGLRIDIRRNPLAAP